MTGALGSIFGGGIGVDPMLYGQSPNATQAQLTIAQIDAMTQASQQVGQAQSPMHPPLGDRARELFLKRMGGVRAEMRVAKDDFLQCHIYGDVVHMFYCFSGKTGVVQESIDMFPSDQLITQFRMILC